MYLEKKKSYDTMDARSVTSIIVHRWMFVPNDLYMFIYFVFFCFVKFFSFFCIYFGWILFEISVCYTLKQSQLETMTHKKQKKTVVQEINFEKRTRFHTECTEHNEIVFLFISSFSRKCYSRAVSYTECVHISIWLGNGLHLTKHSLLFNVYNIAKNY